METEEEVVVLLVCSRSGVVFVFADPVFGIVNVAVQTLRGFLLFLLFDNEVHIPKVDSRFLCCFWEKVVVVLNDE